MNDAKLENEGKKSAASYVTRCQIIKNNLNMLTSFLYNIQMVKHTVMKRNSLFEKY